jgi:hypothetical protein
VNDARAPLARIPLLDGRELVIAPDAARVGERVYLMSRVQEARLLFLQPETIGLRMADIGLVEYSVARRGDGQRALDAIYAVRPELRRADAEPPAPFAPPGYQAAIPVPSPSPAPGWGAPLATAQRPAGVYPYPPSPPAPHPVPFPPQIIQAYGPRPERRYAILSPAPRSAGQLARAAYALAARRFWPLLALSLLVVLLPNVALGLLSIAVAVISGQDPWAAASNPLTTQPPTNTQPQPSDMAQALTLIGLVAGLLLAGWTVATMTLAARDIALGRPLPIFARAREGAQRLWPVISTLIITNFILLAIAVPGLGFALGLILIVYQPTAQTPPISPSAAAVIVTLAVGLALSTLALLAWVWPRIALAPTAAALGMPTPFRTAWGLAQGGAWRILGALVAVGVLTAALLVPATLAQFASDGLSAVLLIPLAQLVSAPLTALVRTLALYDQRLRRERYALFLQEGVTPPPTPGAPDGGPATESL